MKFIGSVLKMIINIVLVVFGLVCLLVAYDKYIRNRYPIKYVSFEQNVPEE